MLVGPALDEIDVRKIRRRFRAARLRRRIKKIDAHFALRRSAPRIDDPADRVRTGGTQQLREGEREEKEARDHHSLYDIHSAKLKSPALPPGFSSLPRMGAAQGVALGLFT